MKKGFTLAEIIAVVALLGVVASITIPGTIHKNIERANKTKIKKALAVYNTVIDKIIVENDLPRTQQSLINYLGRNCQNATKYFKSSELENSGNNCRFRASDGLWWDITDITNTIVAFKYEDLNSTTAGGGQNKAFKFVTRFDGNGTSRINDKSFSTHSYRRNDVAYPYNGGDKQIYDISYIEAIKKVEAYLNNEAYYENLIAKFSEPCNSLAWRCGEAGACNSCTQVYDRGENVKSWPGRYVIWVWDENGKERLYMYNCNPDTSECMDVSTETQGNKDNGNFIPYTKDLEIHGYDCDNTLTVCGHRNLRKTNKDGSTCTCHGCNGQTVGSDTTWTWSNGSYTDEDGVKHTVYGNSCKANNSCATCTGNCPERDATDHCIHL